MKRIEMQEIIQKVLEDYIDRDCEIIADDVLLTIEANGMLPPRKYPPDSRREFILDAYEWDKE